MSPSPSAHVQLVSPSSTLLEESAAEYQQREQTAAADEAINTLRPSTSRDQHQTYEIEVKPNDQCPLSVDNDQYEVQTADNLSDPARYINRRQDDAMISELLATKPCQPTHPLKIEQSTSLQPRWFFKDLPDKTIERRLWLSYSISQKALFCTTCIAFRGPTASKVWTSTGFNDWNHTTCTRCCGARSKT